MSYTNGYSLDPRFSIRVVILSIWTNESLFKYCRCRELWEKILSFPYYNVSVWMSCHTDMLWHLYVIFQYILPPSRVKTF